MANREISNLDLKIKLTLEYLNNGGITKIFDLGLLKDLQLVKQDHNGVADPDTISTRVNAFMLALLASHLHPPAFSSHHLSEYGSTLQKAKCFDQENIDTIEQFDKIYEENKVKSTTLFRGQREAKWRLYSKLQRHWIGESLYETEDNYSSFIERMIQFGLADYKDQLKELLTEKKINNENSVSVLSYLQHHGCPTPLLDWTYSFPNALFFGLDGLEQNPGTIEILDYFSVYFIEEKYFESGNMLHLMDETLSIVEKEEWMKLFQTYAKNEEHRKAMEEHFLPKPLLSREKATQIGLMAHWTKIDHLMTFPICYFSDKDSESGLSFSMNNSQNILNQQGVFTWNADPTKPFEMIGDELNSDSKEPDEAGKYKFSRCFNIHKSLEGHIRHRLEEDGITREFIYPSAETNAWAVFEKSKTKKPL